MLILREGHEQKCSVNQQEAARPQCVLESFSMGGSGLFALGFCCNTKGFKLGSIRRLCPIYISIYLFTSINQYL